jgi:glyoxylase-like metal-dependent hydrolase (beta-lactamase superfamily II)
MRYRSLEISEFDDSFYVCKPSRGGNIGLCVKNQKAIVIDSGYFPDTAVDLISYLDEALEAEPVLLFNTHYHSDHTFGNQAFNCQILASNICRAKMQEGLSSFWSPKEIAIARAEDPYLDREWRHLKITLPTVTFDDKYEYSFEGIRVIFKRLGGHTPGSSVAHFPKQQIVYAGDLIFSGVYPTLLDDGDPLEMGKALPTLKAMSLTKFVPGHGDICDEDVIDSLEEYWRCLITECSKAANLGLDDDAIIEELSGKCRLEDVEYNEFKNKINIKSVLSFIRNKAGIL